MLGLVSAEMQPVSSDAETQAFSEQEMLPGSWQDPLVQKICSNLTRRIARQTRVWALLLFWIKSPVIHKWSRCGHIECSPIFVHFIPLPTNRGYHLQPRCTDGCRDRHACRNVGRFLPVIFGELIKTMSVTFKEEAFSALSTTRVRQGKQMETSADKRTSVC